MTQDKDEALSAALGWPGGISEPLLDRPALLRLVASASAELASMRRSFEAADRERGELRADAERYRWLRETAYEGYPSCEGCRNKAAYLTFTGYEEMYPMTAEQKDAAIDAAIGKAKE